MITIKIEDANRYFCKKTNERNYESKQKTISKLEAQRIVGKFYSVRRDLHVWVTNLFYADFTLAVSELMFLNVKHICTQTDRYL